MNELLAYAILLCEGIVSDDVFNRRLDEIFLENPNDEVLLELECMENAEKAAASVRARFDYSNLDKERFGRAMMKELSEYCRSCGITERFGKKMYLLWESLPGCVQDEEPFSIFTYADDPLSWGDERQSREIYEKAFGYYDQMLKGEH
ncbi:MAG: hypothetical protein K2J73_06475 [Oscillospiraceae bacterium]|nr:hypothetical protein [Oscillospiraceae bacterium]